MKYVNPDLLYDYYNQYLRYWRSQEKIWWLERERERDRAPNWLNTTMTRSLICVTTAATSILLICQHVLCAQVAKMRIWIKKTNEAITYCVMWLWGPIERFRQERYQYLTFSLSLLSPGNGVQCWVAHQLCKWGSVPRYICMCCYHWPQGNGQSKKPKDFSCMLGFVPRE